VSRAKKSVFVTRDRDIRAVLVPLLREKHLLTDRDLVIEEFGCKAARVDVAVVNGVLHGFEIKSDSDSLYRLEDQLDTYLGIFDYVTLVCGKKLYGEIRSSVPSYCGLMLAEAIEDRVTITEKRKARKNPAQRALDLAQMMWKEEALHVLRIRGHRDITSRASASEIWNVVANRVKVLELADELRSAIKLRGGSGFVRRSEQDGDWCTTQSIALPDHYSENLEQLLAVLSPDLHG